MKRHFSMLRDFQLADWFTLANAFCGTGAVFAAMRFLQEGHRGDLLLGMALIPLAFVFDALDGHVARWRKASSTLGRELDSLADVISFGVAPAALGYACGMRGGWDWLVLSYFVCCGVSRLARYNVTAEEIAAADMVILTKDIGIKFEERFAGKTIVRVNIIDAVKRADAIMNKIDSHLSQSA